MNKNFLADKRGQGVVQVGVGVIVVFVALSLGMSLVANFENTNVNAKVPLKDVGFLAVAGIAILAVVLYLSKQVS